MSSVENPDIEKHLKRKLWSYFLVVWGWMEHKPVFHLKWLHQNVVGAFQRPFCWVKVTTCLGHSESHENFQTIIWVTLSSYIEAKILIQYSIQACLLGQKSAFKLVLLCFSPAFHPISSLGKPRTSQRTGLCCLWSHLFQRTHHNSGLTHASRACCCQKRKAGLCGFLGGHF